MRRAFVFLRFSSVGLYSIFDLSCPLGTSRQSSAAGLSPFCLYIFLVFSAFAHFSTFFFDHLLGVVLCFGYRFIEHEISIEFSSILGWMLVSLLMFFNTFSARVRNLLNLQNHILKMNLHDLILQRKIRFDDFHDIFRYLFWLWLLMSFGIDVSSSLGAFWHQFSFCWWSLYFMIFLIYFWLNFDQTWVQQVGDGTVHFRPKAPPKRS